jgi:hypothetical protein
MIETSTKPQWYEIAFTICVMSAQMMLITSHPVGCSHCVLNARLITKTSLAKTL